MKRVLALMVGLTLLPACAQAAPKCSDPKTVETVLQIIRDKTNRQAKANGGVSGIGPNEKTTIHIESVRTTGKDSDTGALSCAADVVVGTTDAPGVRKWVFPIRFKTETTDDGKPYVTVKR